MKWQSKKPKIPGWYWLRSAGDIDRVVHVVELGQMYCISFGFVSQLHGQWAGPIPKPEEA